MTVRCDRIEGKRFGLLADTHDDLVDWPEVAGRIEAKLGRVDALLHCGDLCTRAAIDSLSRLAPLFAVHSQADPAPEPPVLVDGPRVLEGDGFSLGLVVALNGDPVGATVDPSLRFDGLAVEDVCPRLFGRPVDVCAFGGSHRLAMASCGNTVFLNPGSPTLADETSLVVIEFDRGALTSEPIRM